MKITKYLKIIYLPILLTATITVFAEEVNKADSTETIAASGYPLSLEELPHHEQDHLQGSRCDGAVGRVRQSEVSGPEPE